MHILCLQSYEVIMGFDSVVASNAREADASGMTVRQASKFFQYGR